MMDQKETNKRDNQETEERDDPVDQILNSVLYNETAEFDDDMEESVSTDRLQTQEQEFMDDSAFAYIIGEDEIPPKKKKKGKRRGKIFSLFYVLGVLAVCLVISFLCLSVINDVLAVSKPDTAIEVTIPEGAGTKEISKVLKENGLIKHDWVFQKISQYEKYDGKYAPGEHVLNTNMGYTMMMLTMQEQAVRETVKVTIPEGLTLSKISKIMEEKGVCKATDFMEKINSTDFGFSFESQIPSDGTVFYKMEGYLFPDTYEFYKNDNPLNVIRKMMKTLETKVTPEMQDRMAKQGMSFHKLLTIASIVQAEAPNVAEMKKVASVYLNRLNDSANFARLDADPTRDYATEQITGTQGDKKIADAYNTYVGKGLPPGPINNPGLDAMIAVLEPEKTPYYFFCTDLRSGEFYYAKTLSEHNKNVQKSGLRQNSR